MVILVASVTLLIALTKPCQVVRLMAAGGRKSQSPTLSNSAVLQLLWSTLLWLLRGLLPCPISFDEALLGGLRPRTVAAYKRVIHRYLIWLDEQALARCSLTSWTLACMPTFVPAESAGLKQS